MSEIWMPLLDPALPKYRALHQAIVNAISQGDLAVGQRLPTHRSLADLLGVTVGTVTKAYSAAVSEGWLQSRVGSGTFVAPRNASFSPFPLEARAAPGIVDLSVSVVPPHLDRADALGQAIQNISLDSERLSEAVRYQHAQGEVDARHAMATLMGMCGIQADPDELLLTLGGQHGLALAADVLVKSGGRLATAEFGYQGIIGLSKLKGIRLLAVPMKDGQLDVGAFANQCKQQRVDAVYVTPEFHNPTAVQMSDADRQCLADLARQHDFWIIEDRVHSAIVEAGVPTLFDLAPDRTITVFSTSKLLAGGLRVGAIRVPNGHQPRFAWAIKSHSWMVPPLMAQVVTHWVEQGRARGILQWQQQEMIERQALAERLLGDWIEFPPQPGCFYVWLKLPEDRVPREVAMRLLERGIKLADGEPFWVGQGKAPNRLRLCLSGAINRTVLESALATLSLELQMQPQDFVTV